MTTIVMTNSFRGGTGKSTIISNTAYSIASFGYRVLIIDADVISPGVHALFGLDKESFGNTLTEYLTKKAKLQDCVYDISQTVGLVDESLFIMPSSMLSGSIVDIIKDQTKFERLFKDLKKIQDDYDFIFIDTHPGLNNEFLISLNYTDVLLNIIRPDNQDYQGVQVTAEIAAKTDLETYLIVNKVHPKLDKRKVARDITKNFKLPVAGVIAHANEVLDSQSRYLMCDQHPNHEFSQSILKIIEKFSGIKPKEHLEAMRDILQAADPGSISYKELAHLVNLRKDRLENYLSGLIESGFIKNSKKTFSITPRGEEFLSTYKGIKSFVKGFRL